MPRFGSRSMEALGSAHPDLRRLMAECIRHYDFSVLEGHRTREEQEKALALGTTTLPWPRSKHNAFPALAVDVVPYPIDWKDHRRFYFLAGFIRGVASQMGIEIRQGADWDGDGQLNDQSFHDLPHVELVLPDVPPAA